MSPVPGPACRRASRLDAVRAAGREQFDPDQRHPDVGIDDDSRVRMLSNDAGRLASTMRNLTRLAFSAEHKDYGTCYLPGEIDRAGACLPQT